MKIIRLLALSLIILPNISIAQNDTINITDANGLKQGYWKKISEEDILVYEGYFKDNKPVGEFKRYYKNGELKALLNFRPDGETAYAKQFYEDGALSAEGLYFNTLKDSTWLYYSYYTEVIKSEENYVKGKKHGVQKIYYDNGKVYEEMMYEFDVKSGPWKQYYDNGTIKLQANYSFNAVDGRYNFYYPNGIIMIIGTFINNKKDGPWVYYTDEGKEKFRLEYDMGTAVNEEAIRKLNEEYFEMVEENMGKFEEPTVEDFFKQPGY